MSHTPSRSRLSRRVLLGAVSQSAWLFAAPSAFAEALAQDEAKRKDWILTPPQTEGPFYPDQLPLDKDNDLVKVGNDTTPAIGEVTDLTGRILDSRGNPIKGATIEIWQVDGKGVYLHSGDSTHRARDTHFQGYGKFETASSGEYRFRTIKPVPYPGRVPHIHVKVRKGERELLTTQCYVKGYASNERDGVYRAIRDIKAREAVTVAFVPVPGSASGLLQARFDIVLGTTPDETQV